MSDTAYKFKYPACGFCRNFQWEAGNTTSGQCSETHTEVATDGDVCYFFNAEYDDVQEHYMALQKMLIEIDSRPKNFFDPYTDASGNNYKGLSRSECMDKFVDSVGRYGLWRELDVMFIPFGGCEYHFAPNVKFYFTSEEYDAFALRISNAIKKFQQSIK